MVEKNPNRHANEGARVIQVIETTHNEPGYSPIKRYWSFEGELLAECDPCLFHDMLHIRSVLRDYKSEAADEDDKEMIQSAIKDVEKWIGSYYTTHPVQREITEASLEV